MSTFLVSLGVMVVAVAFVTWLAVRDADQRATTRRASVRERRAVATAKPQALPRAKPQAPPRPRPTQAPPSRRVAPREVAVVSGPGGRARAGLALSVLVAFVGVVLALAVAGGILFVAQGLRDSVR